jgi:hypothetical protein
MRHFPKEKAVLAVVVSSLIFLAFMFLVTTNNIANVSAVEANGVGVYWDSHCTDRVPSIDWGTLKPGSVKSIVIYIRNEDEEPIYFTMSTTNWNPSKASDYITVGWNYSGRRIDLGGVLQINLILSISQYVEGISNFGFDIVISGSQNLPGDVNGDGQLTTTDLSILNSLLVRLTLELTTMEDVLVQYPTADVNGDGQLTTTDLAILKSLLTKIILEFVKYTPVTWNSGMFLNGRLCVSGVKNLDLYFK